MRLADERTQKAPAPFNKQARPSDRRPRGQYGPLDHWRLGLVGAVKYWSNGSKAEAAIYRAWSIACSCKHTQPVAPDVTRLKE